MSLHKAIQHGKERRREWPNEKSVDSWCQNHGRCRRCRNDRLHGRRRLEEAARQEWEEESGA